MNCISWSQAVNHGAAQGAFDSAWHNRERKVNHTDDHWPGNKPDSAARAELGYGIVR
jgi:hypothetical protein